MRKKGNKRMPTPKQKLIYNPIPTSLFLSDMCLLLDEDTAGTIDSFPEFLFWCRHPLVSLCFRR